MSEPERNVPAPGKNRAPGENTTAPLAVYVLYLVGMFIFLVAVVGIVVAYVYRGDAPEWLRSHYTFQIRTFWIGLLIGIVGMITSMILIGWLVLALLAIWWIVRCAVGLKRLNNRKPIADPATWLW